jgi:hypothetical protein
MENKKEMMEAVMTGYSINMQAVGDLYSEYNVPQMLINYHRTISNRNDRIERAKAFWDDISDSRIMAENAKVVEDSKKIAEIAKLLDKLKELIEEG